MLDTGTHDTAMDMVLRCTVAIGTVCRYLDSLRCICVPSRSMILRMFLEVESVSVVFIIIRFGSGFRLARYVWGLSD